MTDEPQIDRLSIRERPESMPIMQQTWGKLLFMHWRLPAETLRAHVPARLELDTFEGEAWLAVTPFTIWGMRASFLPAIPGFSEMHELNVRTYVHYRGTPGVYFFSLDASSALAVMGARTFFLVPYFNAEMSLAQDGEEIVYHSRRTHADAPAASFDATWKIGDALGESAPGSLEFFLTERYCFYTVSGESVYRCRIHHAPWQLREAQVSPFKSTMIESHLLPTPKGKPLLHYSEELAVDVWTLEKV
ncbi:MAG: YqjF family protein [Pyrinomonadaceae bacterium]